MTDDGIGFSFEKMSYIIMDFMNVSSRIENNLCMLLTSHYSNSSFGKGFNALSQPLSYTVT